MGDEDAFMGGGSKTFPFDTVGDSITGRILSIKQRQQTDMQTNELAFWPDGKPKMMFTIELQTKIREDEEDDGIRTINVRWKSQEAVQKAVKLSGAKKPEVGGILTLTFTGEGVATQRGFSKPKFWSANYVPPDPSASFMDHQNMPAPDERTLGIGARSGSLTQARNVDHQGRPQDTDAPDWAQPQGITTDQRALMDRKNNSAQAAMDRLGSAGGLSPEAERQKYGF
jgi:hypothetical protein